MTQEDKELLLRDLSARLPYGVICNVKDDKINKVYTLNGVERGGCTFQSRMALYGWNSFVIKPYLRPMSSMTEEETKEIAILHGIKDILSVKVTSDYIDITVDDGVCSTETRTIWYDEIISSIEIFDWLNAHHFDYRGLIPLGLAIAVTEENNPYKE